MISLLVTLLIMCLIYAVIWWILTLIPLPPPVGNIVRVAVAVLFLIWLIYMLLPYAGGHPLLR
jgi:hypothetical protein